MDLDPTPNMLTLKVNPVNDAPEGKDASLTLNGDGTYAFDEEDFGFTDPLDEPSNKLKAVTITTLPSKGSLKFNGEAVKVEQTIPAASISQLVYIGNPNDTSADSFKFKVQDDGGTANGGVDTDTTANTLTLSVNSADDVLEYTVRRSDDGRYRVYMRPTANPENGKNQSLTGQITLTVPTGKDKNQFLVDDLQSAIDGVTWSFSSRTNAPSENSDTDYLSFTFGPEGTDKFAWQAGQELEVFSFKNPNACKGFVQVMAKTDPFNKLPNSANTVPSNQFTNLGWGSATDNNYRGNYGTPVDCFTNSAPVITSNDGAASADLEVAESQTTVTTVTATDEDGHTLTYSISGGADAGKFVIDATTGVLTFKDAPDYETPADADGDNVYEVQVKVSDGKGGSAVQNLRVKVTDAAESLMVRVKAFLQGPFNSSTRLMRDNLRTLNLIPSAQPYDVAPFNHKGTEQVDKALLSVSGKDAIVDWVLVELRKADAPSTVVASKAALLQRDGDVVDASTGSKDLAFAAQNSGKYYVALRHRNHLGVMSADALSINATPILVDFTATTTAVSGSEARLNVDTTALLWAGDINKSNSIIINGPNNDVTNLLAAVLSSEGNTMQNANYLLSGYDGADTDMNGYTLFAGPNNDTNLLVGNVLLHPANKTFSANFMIKGGIPLNNN